MVLCDARNGYPSFFSVYRGKNREVRSSSGLGYYVVLSLIESDLSQWYFLCIFYTSPTLVSDLYNLGVHVTGTLDSTHTGVTAEIPCLKKEMEHKSGSCGNGSYVRDVICVHALWKYTKCVCVMSNEQPSHSESKVRRNAKDVERGGGGGGIEKEVPIPIIYNHNCFMNGVDLSDHL